VTVGIELAILVVALGAGILGSMVGLGGGVFMVPIFSVFLGVPLKTAIAASAVSVVVNSLGGAAVYLRHRMVNLRLGLLLLISTTLGAIIGGLLVLNAPVNALRVVFAITLYAMVMMMLRQRTLAESTELPDDPLGLRASYYDPARGEDVTYVPTRVLPGMGLSTIAGVVSGLLGIGGGAVQVPLMNAIMRVPVKAAAATSVFMVGITVVASALLYYTAGLISPEVAAPAILGVFLGSQTGSQLARRVRGRVLSRILIVILLYLATTILLQAFGIQVPGAR
jgi:uncharacterized membrane protein YfcA